MTIWSRIYLLQICCWDFPRRLMYIFQFTAMMWRVEHQKNVSSDVSKTVYTSTVKGVEGNVLDFLFGHLSLCYRGVSFDIVNFILVTCKLCKMTIISWVRRWSSKIFYSRARASGGERIVPLTNTSWRVNSLRSLLAVVYSRSHNILSFITLSAILL